MVLLLRSLNVFLTLFIKSVLSRTCPFCVNVKSECDNEKNVLTMHCQTVEIDGEPAVNHIKEPRFWKDKFVTKEFLEENKDSITFSCVAVDYEIERISSDISSNPYENEIHTDRKYTLRTCVVVQSVAAQTFCESLRNADYLKKGPAKIKNFKLKVDDNCTITTADVRDVETLETTTKVVSCVSTLYDRLVIFIVPIVLLILFI